jgi:hypothetical protein
LSFVAPLSSMLSFVVCRLSLSDVVVIMHRVVPYVSLLSPSMEVYSVHRRFASPECHATTTAASKGAPDDLYLSLETTEAIKTHNE